MNRREMILGTIGAVLSGPFALRRTARPLDHLSMERLAEIRTWALLSCFREREHTLPRILIKNTRSYPLLCSVRKEIASRLNPEEFKAFYKRFPDPLAEPEKFTSLTDLHYRNPLAELRQNT